MEEGSSSTIADDNMILYDIENVRMNANQYKPFKVEFLQQLYIAPLNFNSKL